MQNKLFCIALVGLFVGSALPMRAQVSTDWDRTADFTAYKTYTWLKAEGGNSLWTQRLQEDVDAQLAARGWTKAPANGDAALMAFRRTTTEQDLETIYDGFGGGWRWRGFGGFGTATTIPETIKVGNIVVDIFDSRSQRLLWRSKDSDDLSSNVDKNIERLQKDIGKMFHNFPPK